MPVVRKSAPHPSLARRRAAQTHGPLRQRGLRSRAFGDEIDASGGAARLERKKTQCPLTQFARTLPQPKVAQRAAPQGRQPPPPLPEIAVDKDRGNAEFCMICGIPFPCHQHVFPGNAPKGATAGAPDVTLGPTAAAFFVEEDLSAAPRIAAELRNIEMPMCADIVERLAARIRELEAEREKLIEGFRLIEVDLEAGDLPPRIRVPLALRRVKAWIKRSTSAVQVAEGSREAALHQSPGSPPKTENVDNG